LQVKRAMRLTRRESGKSVKQGRVTRTEVTQLGWKPEECTVMVHYKWNGYQGYYGFKCLNA
jgi:hypothetical protein